MIILKILSIVLMILPPIDMLLLGVLPSEWMTNTLIFIGAVLGLICISKENNLKRILFPAIAWLLVVLFNAIYFLQLSESAARNPILPGWDIMQWLLLAGLSEIVATISTIVLMFKSSNPTH